MPKHRRQALSALALWAALAGPAFAQGQPDDTDWTVVVPPVGPGPVTPPSTPEGGFGSPDRTRFDEKLRDRVLDQLCRQIKLKQDINLGEGDFSGTSLGIERYLATRTDGKLALVEVQGLKLGYGKGLPFLLDGGPLSAGINLGVSVQGKSMVVRPLEGTKTCSELDRLLNVFDIKTVFPVSAKRVSEMAVGELWRIPLTLTFSQGLGLNGSGASAGTPETAASISFGRQDTGAASMTLYRLSDDKTRFRFRIDHVVVKSASLGINEALPTLALPEVGNILLKLLEHQLTRQLSRYTSAWLTFGMARSDGKRMLMEFVADPRDPAQAKALSAAVKGDFEELLVMAARMSTLLVTDESTKAAYERLRGKHAETLGPPTYAAANDYKTKTRSFNFNLPFFYARQAQSLFGDDKVTRYTGEAGDFQFYRADKSRASEGITIPWVGPLFKNNIQRNVEAVTFAAPGESHSEPILVYIHNQGYLRNTQSSVREDVESLNSVMNLAGAQRGAQPGRMILPLESIAPPPTPDTRAARRRQDDDMPAGERTDRKGWTSFTLVFNQKAVREALSATTATILKAFSAILDPIARAKMEWLTDHGTYQDGKLVYSQRDARRIFHEDFRQDRDSRDEMRSLARQAANLLADLTAARDAKTNQDRAEALTRFVGGKGKSGLAYEDALKVLVQLVDPLDLTGDFVANIQAMSKKSKDSKGHYVLKKDRQEVALLKDAGETKSRFAEPSILVD